MYSVLYESMIAWYARRNVAREYRHRYAVTTLTSMAFGNVLSIVVLAAYFDLAWGKAALAAGRMRLAAIALGIAILVAHILYFRKRSPLAAAGSWEGTRTPWLALGYIVLTVVVFLYVSPMAAALLRKH